MSRVTAIIATVIILLIASLLWAVNHYRDNAIAFKDQRDKAAHELKMANDTIADMQTRQRDVAALDAKYTRELADAKAQNDALQRKLDIGGRVLVKGRCPVPATTKTTGSSSLGNDPNVELTDLD